jgi:hypothetical protein
MLVFDFEVRGGILSVLNSRKTVPALRTFDIKMDEDYWHKPVANCVSLDTSFRVSGVDVRYLDPDDVDELFDAV